jgi:hypothetical protein
MTPATSYRAVVIGPVALNVPFVQDAMYRLWRELDAGKELRDIDDWAFRATSAASSPDSPKPAAKPNSSPLRLAYSDSTRRSSPSGPNPGLSCRRDSVVHNTLWTPRAHQMLKPTGNCDVAPSATRNAPKMSETMQARCDAFRG